MEKTKNPDPRLRQRVGPLTYAAHSRRGAGICGPLGAGGAGAGVCESEGRREAEQTEGDENGVIDLDVLADDVRKELTGKERKAFDADVAKVIGIVIDTMVKLADKYNVNRDSALRYFAELIDAVSELSTVEHWGEDESHD